MVSFIVGGFIGLLGLLGLLMAAHAHDDGIYVMGLGMFLFACLFDFSLLKQHFDRQDSR